MKYREILEAAIRAPSGDNCQPWRVEIDVDTVKLFNVPERDTSLYNYKQRASLVAHGAFLENFSIAASALGHHPKITTFPDPADSNLIASVELSPCIPQNEPLYPCIHKRTINRRPYSKKSLTDSERDGLDNAAAAFPGLKLNLIEDPGNKKRLAKVIGLNDRLVFENRQLHSFLFDHLRWSEEEAVSTGDGLDVRTLELSPPDALAFRLFRSWSFVRFLNNLGLSHIVQIKGASLADSSSAIGAITIPGTEPVDYVNAGRLMERLWLEATRLGLAFHLMTGLTFLFQRKVEGATDCFQPEHLSLLNSATEDVKKICGVAGEVVALIFRVGQCNTSTSRSVRYPLEAFLKMV